MLGIPVAVRVVVGAKAASVFEPKIAKERMPKASLMIVRASLNVPPTALCTPQYERPIAKRRKRGRGRGSNNSRLLTSFLYSNFHRSLPSCHRKTATRESQPPLATRTYFYDISCSSRYLGVGVSDRKKVVGCNLLFFRSLFAPGWYNRGSYENTGPFRVVDNRGPSISA